MVSAACSHEDRRSRVIRLRRAFAIAVATLAFVIAGHSASAQGPELRPEYTVFFAGGVSGISTSDVEQRLTASGYPEFDHGPRGFALGAYTLVNRRIMLGGELHALTLGRTESAATDVGLDAGYATLGVGYAFDVSPRVRLYPRLGLGL